MDEIFPDMIERPDTGNIIAGLFCGFLCFVSLPFLLLLFMQGSFEIEGAVGIAEIAYHVINFIIAVIIFGKYLQEAFLTVQIDTKKFFAVCGICTGLILFAATVVFLFAPFFGSELGGMMAFSTLPLAEMELFLLSADLVGLKPILGTICLAVLCPISTSCFFYATAFAPAACKRPWLGYLLTALVLFIPRFCNGVTHWVFSQEMLLYFCQLPIHMLSCWAYQKTDTVWAPIVTHMMVNLVSAVLIIIVYIL